MTTAKVSSQMDAHYYCALISQKTGTQKIWFTRIIHTTFLHKTFTTKQIFNNVNNHVRVDQPHSHSFSPQWSPDAYCPFYLPVCCGNQSHNIMDAAPSICAGCKLPGRRSSCGLPLRRPASEQTCRQPETPQPKEETVRPFALSFSDSINPIRVSCYGLLK